MNNSCNNTFFNGKVSVRQNPDGYRFSIDSVLLAWAAGKIKADTIVDLGTGCGIMPIILAYRNPETLVYGIEIQKGLFDLAAQNIKANQMEKSVRLFSMDFKNVKAGFFPNTPNLVISNPPYRNVGSGRLNPHSEKACARHEISATLADVVSTAGRLLNISGKFLTIYPSWRMAELLSCMQSFKIEPKYVRSIHGGPDTEAKLVIVCGTKGGRPGMKLDPPLFIYKKESVYTDEVAKMFEP